MQTILITGATSGIGKVTALELARLGHTVVFTARDAQKAAETQQLIQSATGNPNIEFLLGDLSNLEDVRRIASQFQAKFDRLDVLINNAGGFFQTRHSTHQNLELTFATNHLAYFLLTNLLLSTLQKSSAARVINVASSAQAQGKINFDDLQFERGYSGMTAYFQSKLANVVFSNTLAKRLEGSRITVNSLHPGVVRSGFGTGTGGFIGMMFGLIRQFGSITPEEGAKTTLFLATDPSLAGVSGQYFERRSPKNPNPIANDAKTQQQLWDISAKLTGWVD